MPPASSKKRSSTTRSCVGRRAERRRGGGEIFDELLRAGRADADLLEPAAGPNRRDGSERSRLSTSSRRRETDGESASVRPGASPSQKGMFGGWPFASSTRTIAALDPLDAIGGVAELEHVARHALDGKILVDGADDVVLGLEQHLIVGGVGDRAAGGQRGRPRAAPAAQDAVDRVAMDQRAAPAVAGGEAVRQHPTTASNSSRVRLRNGQARRRRSNSFASGQSCAAVSATICCASTSSGFSGIVSRSSSPRRTLSSSAAHSTRSSRDSGKSRPFGVPSTAWPERPARCRKVAIDARRTELADELDVADVDAELERGGRHHRPAVRRA